jgi:MinD superfamily P-loop ATPase
MIELVVASGKGGTGKTSILASLAVLANRVVVADCDVDAADLHLLLEPVIGQRTPFFAGHEATVIPGACTGCGLCVEPCRAGAIRLIDGRAKIDPFMCEGCGLCWQLCADQAIEFKPRFNGEWYVSDTRVGPMVHARLEPGAESSGKLVTLVRNDARRLAAERGIGIVLVDGPPGVGCPVIATMGGASRLLAVAEPTPSGVHDLGRLLELADHFQVPSAIAINKWDLNPELTAAIEGLGERRHTPVVGRIPYDLAVTTAQVAGRTAVEVGGAGADAIIGLFESLRPMLDEGRRQLPQTAKGGAH